jgi:hypothetical protein
MEQGQGRPPQNLGSWRDCEVCAGALADLLEASDTVAIEQDQATTHVVAHYMEEFHGRHSDDRYAI